MRNKFLITVGCFSLLILPGCFSNRAPVASGNLLKPRELAPVEVGKAFVQSTPSSTAVSLTFFGDMMLDRNVKKQIDKNGADYIFEKLWAEASTTLFASNIISANLEGPFANSRRQTSKSIAFRFDPVLIPTLQKYKFNVFNLANNHSADMSAAGFAESTKNLKAAGFDFYGKQYGLDNTAVLHKKIDDKEIIFVGINDTNTEVTTDELEKIFKNFSATDTVIVNIHWGQEYKTISNIRQRTLAHWLVDSGADIIIGHHPHVTEEMEIYKNRPIFYSLGNFVFDQYFSTETQQGLAVKINLEDKQMSVSVFPLQGIQSQVSLMNDENYFSNWAKTCRLSGNNFVSSTLILNYD